MDRGYIKRTLHLGDQTITEDALLLDHKTIIVLAEPGAGKSVLLASLAFQLGVAPIRASLFRHRNIPQGSRALVIDALDELARIGDSAIEQVIEKTRESGAARIVLASRSSEWDKQRTLDVAEAFAHEPAVIRLKPFTPDEQRILFEQHVPGEDFAHFRQQAERFELSLLLGNPQFLKLFADAYVQRGRKFVSKRQIFIDAIEKLASEPSTTSWQRNRPPVGTIVAIAEELLAKVMLSGASGISVADDGDRDFPYLLSLSFADPTNVALALNTRLFKPTNEPVKHEPVHRIVAEYCAARYLARRVSDPADTLSLGRVFSVVAPNGAVRDELRGLVGWIAALGSPPVQEACIRIDPYAVLANGDPSQLSLSSKRLLLAALQQLAVVDPYFRRSDRWRRFSVAGLFTQDILPELRAILSDPAAVSDLRNLVLELLGDSPVASDLTDTLREIVLDMQMDVHTRIRAQRILFGLESFDHTILINELIGKGDAASLRVASESVETLGQHKIGLPTTVALLARIGTKTSKRSRHDDDARFALRYSTKQLIAGLDLTSTVALLDELTRDLQCTCGKSRTYECECMPGPSKIIGSLLDRYFELAYKPHDPPQVWQWTKNLVFPEHIVPQESVAVRHLQEADDLRRGIYRIAFANLNDDGRIWDMRVRFWSGDRHAGLQMKPSDLFAITEEARASGNVRLWAGFYASHNLWAENKGPDRYRAHLREQAFSDPNLLKEWSARERNSRRMRHEQRDRWLRRQRRLQIRESKDKETRAKFYRDHKARIEAGQHWGALYEIANHYLIEPDKLTDYLDDPDTADTALRNAFLLLLPHVPTLAAVREKSLKVTRVLHAACLATFRGCRTLEHLDQAVLRVVKTDVGGYQGYREKEGEAFEAEIDRLIFPNVGELEHFAREFIEPQLSRTADSPTDVGWLNYKKAFAPLLKTLPLEWLTRFPDMPHTARDTLFNLSAKYANREALNALISARCEAILAAQSDTEDSPSPLRGFWLLRGFFFLPDPPDGIWSHLRSDPNVLLAIESYAGRFSRDEYGGWPALSAAKIYGIYDTYIEAWPKVYLPSSYGTGSPPGETAYRFLMDIIYMIDRDQPHKALAALEQLLADARFSDLHAEAKSLKAAALRKQALGGYEPPPPTAINEMLEQNRVASVEDLRSLLVDDLAQYQVWLRKAETNPLAVFHPGDGRLDENGCRDRIADHLNAQMRSRNLSVVIEHHFAEAKRCDFTAAATVGGRRHLLVVEVKGQWHSQLLTAASAQLHERYSSHPDAALQGIYLVLWFGSHETVAGRRNHQIQTPAELYALVTRHLPSELKGAIDVVVLDLSKRAKSF